MNIISSNYYLRHFKLIKILNYIPKNICCVYYSSNEKLSPRMEEFKKKLREKTPIEPWPNSTNPHTGEIGGPKGPEPTRYGDWERKGRVTDF
ncbi:hypothetical protein GWI33_002525 [Rhynchophorus ferrugineus]|uniref:Succinate dehydrogenase assembly factor 4, mitochondrial n=1 Tax=Rhynchophorus ferrugineus TaxID=354439 RepID=A0A834ITY0_RHYFE|nr:hypothetical protein GWI33_002525 [Rhynchophorus ferrugineus]